MPNYYLVKSKENKKIYLVCSESSQGAEKMLTARNLNPKGLEWVNYDSSPYSLMVGYGVHNSSIWWNAQFAGGAIPVLDVTRLLPVGA